MVGRGEITDVAWEQIEPLLPENGRKGGRWRDHRTVIDGILWKLRTGAPWRDLPERYGSWLTCFDRFNRWRRDGTWDRLVEYAQSKRDAVGQIEWEVSVDDTAVRAHQHAAGAGKRFGKEDAKEALERGRRSARAKSRWAVYQGTSDLRWQGETTLGPPHAQPEAR
jgi:transposase